LSLGLVLALVIGVALGLFGGGGSMLAVPTLVYVMGLPTRSAVSSSLVIVGVTSAVALIPHLRARLVEKRTGLLFGAGSMLGAYAGGAVAQFVPEALLLAGFGMMMSVTALAMLRAKPGTESQSERRAPTSKLSLYGFAVGILAGILGAGGGFLIVPALTLLGGLPMKRAVATSLLVITLQSFAGFLGHLGHTEVPIGVVVPFTLLAATGSVFGSALVTRLRAAALRRGFASMVLGVALFVVGHQLSRLAHAPPAYIGFRHALSPAAGSVRLDG
jgi:uncharacterized membrane protein YfcA